MTRRVRLRVPRSRAVLTRARAAGFHRLQQRPGDRSRQRAAQVRPGRRRGGAGTCAVSWHAVHVLWLTASAGAGSLAGRRQRHRQLVHGARRHGQDHGQPDDARLHEPARLCHHVHGARGALRRGCLALRRAHRDTPMQEVQKNPAAANKHVNDPRMMQVCAQPPGWAMCRRLTRRRRCWACCWASASPPPSPGRRSSRSSSSSSGSASRSRTWR